MTARDGFSALLEFARTGGRAKRGLLLDALGFNVRDRWIGDIIFGRCNWTNAIALAECSWICQSTAPPAELAPGRGGPLSRLDFLASEFAKHSAVVAFPAAVFRPDMTRSRQSNDPPRIEYREPLVGEPQFAIPCTFPVQAAIERDIWNPGAKKGQVSRHSDDRETEISLRFPR